MTSFRMAGTLAAITLAVVSPVAAELRTAVSLGRQVLTAGLDPDQCYRIRDLEISRPDVRLYLTDGYLMFGKPVNGSPLTAVFSADTDGGDAEVLLLPPDRAERKSMAAYTGSPNLSEHFAQAAFIFTDDTAKNLLQEIQSAGSKKTPEIGAVMVERWGSLVANLMTGFESRIVLDMLTPGAETHGFFEAVIQGRKLGNFDVICDSRAYEQVIVGRVTTRDGESWWDTWASFTGREFRGKPQRLPEEKILGYRIEATLDSALNMRCVTRIRVRISDESREVLPFDLSGQMRATGAKIDGQPAEVYQRDSVRSGLIQNSGNELLMVLPAKALAAGTEHEIEISHEGRVIADAGHGVYFVSARGSWYPARGLQFATYDVTYRYPGTLDLVAAGRISEERTDGDMKITRRITSGPVRLLGFNLGRYERARTERNGITVEVCANRELEDALRPRTPPVDADLGDSGRLRRRPGATLPRDSTLNMAPQSSEPASQISHIADQVEDAIAFYRSKLGDPPLKQIEVSPIPRRFGQGFAGMIYLPTVNYLTGGLTEGASINEQRYFHDLLTAHEVAHQWWGNIVSTGSYHHEWLMEALASYSAVLYLEKTFGPKGTDVALDTLRRVLFQKGPDGETAESEGAVVQGRRLEGSNNPNASNAVIYGKGTWIMHMLRRRMGDENFLRMLTELRRRYEWKTLDTEDFRRLCAEFLPAGSSDPKLETFFDQWVYGTGVPSLKLNFSVKGRPGAYKLTGTVTQTGVPDDFSVAVPVEIQTVRGKALIRQVRTGSDPAEFSVPVAGPNAKAVLDPGRSVLQR